MQFQPKKVANQIRPDLHHVSDWSATEKATPRVARAKCKVMAGVITVPKMLNNVNWWSAFYCKHCKCYMIGFTFFTWYVLLWLVNLAGFIISSWFLIHLSRVTLVIIWLVNLVGFSLVTWVLFVWHLIRALWLVSSASVVVKCFEMGHAVYHRDGLRVDPFYDNGSAIFSVIIDWEFVSRVFFSKIFQTVIRKCINYEALFNVLNNSVPRNIVRNDSKIGRASCRERV